MSSFETTEVESLGIKIWELESLLLSLEGMKMWTFLKSLKTVIKKGNLL